MESNNVHIVNLSNYVSPIVKEEFGKPFVTYGKKNSYFDYLIDRSRGSATNGAIINSVIDMIYGTGLSASNKSQRTNEYAKMKSIFKDDDVKKIVNDLKRMGMFAMQIQYKGGHKSINSATHIPIELLAPEQVDDEGNINAYYFSRDWKRVNGTKDTKRIPAFGTSKEGIEILYVRPYRSGMTYFSNVDYQGGLQYAELEEEIGNYHINNIKNSFAPSMMVNFNNGVPPEEVQKELVNKVTSKYQGSSNAGRVIVAFNDNKENAGTIESVPLSDAADQYQFLSDEAMKKILVSHRVTSPLLMGLSTSTGFGSNADELKTASVLFESLVIKPFRQLITDAFDKVLSVNNFSLDLEFESLNPFETKNIDSIKLSKNYDEDVFLAINEFGESEDLESWDLIDEREVDYELEDKLDNILNLTKPVSIGRAIPNAKSVQDGENAKGEIFKVRYQYFPLQTQDNSRHFCQRMVNAKKIYRKEDIITMGTIPVNPGWGLSGADKYSIWLYKGGGACHHKWFRKTYKLKEGSKNIDVNNPNAQTITTTKARSQGFRPPTNEQEVPVAPIDMPNKGFVNK